MNRDTLLRFALAYLAAGLTMAVLDSAWLTLTNAALYRAELGPMLANGFRPGPAVAFYLIYLMGVAVFGAEAGRWRGSITRAAGRGALLGLVAYATYDLTNQATLAIWSPRVTAFDLAWGTTLTAVASLIGRAALNRLRLRL